MGRPLRQAVGGIVYHVLNRRVLRLRLFEDNYDYLAFERVLAEAMCRPEAPALLTLSLMPNHWHLVVRPKRDGDLPKWMQWLTVTHTHRWHAHHGTAGTGSLYQGRFKSFPVQHDEHFLAVARYVEQNALRARLAPGSRAERWRWSGLWLRDRRNSHDLTEVESQLNASCSTWPVARPSNWIRRVNQTQAANQLETLRRSVVRGSPFGSDRWSRRIATRLALQSTLRPRGRPRKDNKAS